MKFSKSELLLLIGIFLLTLLPSRLGVRYSFQIPGIEIRANEWAFILLLTCSLFISKRVNKRNHIHTYEAIFILFIMYVLLSAAILVIAGSMSWSNLYYAVSYNLIPFIFFRRLKNVEQRKILLIINTLGLILIFQVFMMTFFYESLFEIAGWDLNIFELSNNLLRARTTFGAATISAFFFFICIAINISDLLKEWKLSKLFFVILYLISILLLQTRSVIIAMLVISVYISMMLLKLNIRKFFQSTMLIIFILLIVLLISPNVYYNLFERFFTERAYESNIKRLNYISESMAYFSDYPILGSGFGFAFTRISDTHLTKEKKPITAPHNQHLAYLVETGLIGYLIIILFFTSVMTFYLKRGHKNKCLKFILFTYFLLIFFLGQFETFSSTSLQSSLIPFILLAYLRKEYESEVKLKKYKEIAIDKIKYSNY